MTRLEKVAKAAELAGTTPIPRIAAMLGVSPKYVYELLNDPDGEKAARRQRRKRAGGSGAEFADLRVVAPAGNCRSCGCTLSSYRGLVDPNRPRLGFEVYCAPCAPEWAGYYVTAPVDHTFGRDRTRMASTDTWRNR